jgi:hypothetical protein
VLRAAWAVTVGAALIMGGAAAARPAADDPGLNSVSATLSSARAGARPVAVTLTMHMELQCGRLIGGALVVRLPAQERVPATVAATAVQVGGKPAGAVAVKGHILTVSVPRPRGMMCDSIGPGKLTLVLTRAANLGNPMSAGKYPLVIARGNEQFKTMLAIG